MKDIIKNKSVGLPESLIKEVSERADKENRSFSNMVTIHVNRRFRYEQGLVEHANSYPDIIIEK